MCETLVRRSYIIISLAIRDRWPGRPRQTNRSSNIRNGNCVNTEGDPCISSLDFDSKAEWSKWYAEGTPIVMHFCISPPHFFAMWESGTITIFLGILLPPLHLLARQCTGRNAKSVSQFSARAP